MKYILVVNEFSAFKLLLFSHISLLKTRNRWALLAFKRAIDKKTIRLKYRKLIHDEYIFRVKYFITHCIIEIKKQFCQVTLLLTLSLHNSFFILVYNCTERHLIRGAL
jgi:hypothetical protein